MFCVYLQSIQVVIYLSITFTCKYTVCYKYARLYILILLHYNTIFYIIEIRCTTLLHIINTFTVVISKCIGTRFYFKYKLRIFLCSQSLKHDVRAIFINQQFLLLKQLMSLMLIQNFTKHSSIPYNIIVHLQFLLIYSELKLDREKLFSNEQLT